MVTLVGQQVKGRKIYEWLLLDSGCEFLDKNCLLNRNQFAFQPNDSSVHHLKAITHNRFPAFDANLCLAVCGFFLDNIKGI